jgi:hypothetical protein
MLLLSTFQLKCVLLQLLLELLVLQLLLLNGMKAGIIHMVLLLLLPLDCSVLAVIAITIRT